MGSSNVMRLVNKHSFRTGESLEMISCEQKEVIIHKVVIIL